MAKKKRPDFGTAGQLTIRTDKMGAAIQVSAGESIRAKLTVKGPGTAVFAFGCQHRTLWSGPDFPGHPLPLYSWRHFTQPSDADAAADTYSLTIAFIGGVTSYTYLLEHVNTVGAVLATLKDFDASSTSAADVFHSSITLFVV